MLAVFACQLPCQTGRGKLEHADNITGFLLSCRRTRGSEDYLKNLLLFSPPFLTLESKKPLEAILDAFTARLSLSALPLGLAEAGYWKELRRLTPLHEGGPFITSTGGNSWLNLLAGGYGLLEANSLEL